MEKSLLERFSGIGSSVSPVERIVLCMNFGDQNDISSDGEVFDEIKDEIISFLEEDDMHFVAICGIHLGGASKLYRKFESCLKSSRFSNRIWHPVMTVPRSIHDCDENTRWYWLRESIDDIFMSELWRQATDGCNAIAKRVFQRMTIVVSSWYVHWAMNGESSPSTRMTEEFHRLMSLLNYNQLKFEQRWSKDQLEKIKSKWLENKVALNPEICSKCGCLSHPTTIKAVLQNSNCGKKPQYWLANCAKAKIIAEIIGEDKSEYLLSSKNDCQNGGCPFYLEHAVLKENESNQNEES